MVMIHPTSISKTLKLNGRASKRIIPNRIVQLPFVCEEMGSFPPSAPSEKALQGKYVILIQVFPLEGIHAPLIKIMHPTLYPFVGLDCIPFRSSSWPCAICVVMHLVVVSIVCVAKLYMVHLNRGKYQLTYYRYFMETIVYSILHVCTHLHITCKLYGEFKLF